MFMKSRIPSLHEATFAGASSWFAQMQEQQLLFHPEDDPADILRIADGTRTFSVQEVKEVRLILDTLDRRLGHEMLLEAAYPVFMKTVGHPLPDG